MERKREPQFSTITRPERHQGIRQMLLIDLSFRLRGLKLPGNFPGPDSTVEEVRDYLLSPGTYSHRGFRARR